MYSDNILYTQVVGPVPKETNSTVKYPDNSYSVENIKIPWGWITFAVLFVGTCVAAFFLARKKLRKKDRNEKANDGVLMEVRVLRDNEVEIGSAEKMFANIYGIGGKAEGLASSFSVNNCVSFEMVGLPGEIRFFVHCPRKYADLVEKQILGSYQDADVAVVDEYNIFAPNTEIECSRLILDEDSYYPIRVAEGFTGDPMANILSTLSKMSENEGALVQLVVSPTSY